MSMKQANGTKKTFGQKLKAMFGKRFQAGSYSLFAIAMVLAIAIVANLIVGSLPASQTQLDVSGLNLYNLSDQTKLIVSSVDKDVKMYLICNEGDEDSTITRLMDHYADLSSYISWEVKDPTVDPTFLNNYDLTLNQLYENSVLVEAGSKCRLVGYDEIYVTDYSYDYYSYSYDTTTTFEGENALTNAIHYVASDNLPKVYVISGHGETELDEDLTDSLTQDNFEYETLSLLSLTELPEDAAALIINEPTTDLGEDEAALLISYLENGGNIMLTTSYTVPGDMPNLLKVTESMGLTLSEGLIVEGDKNMHLSRYPWYLLPDVEDTDETSALVSGGYYILVPMAQPITEVEGSTADITWLLTTSSSAYAKVAAMEMTTSEKEDGDTDGPFYVGAVSEKGGKLVWISGDGFTSSYISSAVSGANVNLYMNYLNSMAGQEESISIRGKSLDSTGLTVPSASSSFWSIVMIGLIPVALIAIGIVIMIRRKRR